MSARPRLMPLPLALVSFSLLLSSCSTLLGFTPERAVIREIMQTSDPNFTILPDSVQVLQSVDWNEDVLVIAVYQRSGRNNQIENCLDVYIVEMTRTGWMAGSGGSGCMTAGAMDQPVDAAGGSLSLENEPAISYTYGLVHDPKIAAIEVTWSDEQVQVVEVVNGSYIAIRSDFVFHQKVRGLDAEGASQFASPAIEVAPGK